MASPRCSPRTRLKALIETPSTLPPSARWKYAGAITTPWTSLPPAARASARPWMRGAPTPRPAIATPWIVPPAPAASPATARPCMSRPVPTASPPTTRPCTPSPAPTPRPPSAIPRSRPPVPTPTPPRAMPSRPPPTPTPRPAAKKPRARPPVPMPRPPKPIPVKFPPAPAPRPPASRPYTSPPAPAPKPPAAMPMTFPPVPAPSPPSRMPRTPTPEPTPSTPAATPSSLSFAATPNPSAMPRTFPAPVSGRPRASPSTSLFSARLSGIQMVAFTPCAAKGAVSRKFSRSPSTCREFPMPMPKSWTVRSRLQGRGSSCWARAAPQRSAAASRAAAGNRIGGARTRRSYARRGRSISPRPTEGRNGCGTARRFGLDRQRTEKDIMPSPYLKELRAGSKIARLASLPTAREKFPGVARMPVCLRIVLESLLRNLDGKRVRDEDVKNLASWRPRAEREEEIPFVVSRVLLQDFTGVPLVVDLAAMRSAVKRAAQDPKLVEPEVPVDLVVDHSVQVDFTRVANALQLNMGIEFKRNRPRYEFLKWGMQAYDGLQIVPPGIGIVHQVNLEHLAKGILEKDGVVYPDTLVGPDSHTTMINGLGIVAWGVGGIEAEAAMLGQPVYFLTPDVVGVNLTGSLRDGVTATDLVLRVTEMLRRAKVVGKFVEFHGAGATSLSVTDRATIANMAPEYGATMGFFPVDEETCAYLKATGRTDSQVEAVRSYYKAQGMFGIPEAGQCDYSIVLDLDLQSIQPSVAGPKRPQDRIDLPKLKEQFTNLMLKPVSEGGYGKSENELTTKYHVKMGADTQRAVAGGGAQTMDVVPVVGNDLTHMNTSVWTETEMVNNRPTPDRVAEIPSDEFVTGEELLGHGDVLIAAITSCTNTSNPSVMLAAGLLAKKA